jgi:hypothetical protein
LRRERRYVAVIGSGRNLTVKRTRLKLLLGVGLLLATLAIAATGASAAKKGPATHGVQVITRSATIQLPPHQLLTATATCPPGMRALGGGFSGSPGGIEPTVVTESRRLGGRSWIASGLRASPLTTTSGSLTSFVQCRRGAPKIRERAASATLPAATGPGDHPRATVSATCPGKKRAISGGFSSEADPKQALAVLPQQSQRLAKGRAWSFTASHNNPAPRQLTAYAYCAPLRVATRRGAVSLTGDLTTKAADTTSCGPGTLPIAGGFITSPATLAGGGDIVFVLSSAPQRHSWRATGLHSGAKSTGKLQSFAYCG